MAALKFMEPLAHRAARATWWSAIEIACRYSVQFVVTILLARMLAPTDFGLVAILLVFTTICGVLVNGGFGLALVQSKVISIGDESTVFWTSLFVSFSMFLMLWLAAPTLANFYSQPALEPLAKMSLLLLPLGALAIVPDALMVRRLNFKARAKVELAASTLAGLLAIILAKIGAGAAAILWQAIIAALVRVLLLWCSSGWWPTVHFCAPAFKRLFRFGGYMMIANFMNMISLRLQLLTLGYFFPPQVVGQYTLAQNIQEAPAQLMAGVMSRVGLPTFASAREIEGALQSAMRLSLRASMLVFAPCMLGLAVVSDAVVALLYGDQWLPAAPVLSLLALSAVFWPLHLVNLSALSAIGRADMVFKLEIIKFVVSVPLMLLGGFFGALAIAVAVLISGAVCVFINSWQSKRLLGYGISSQLRDCYGVFFLAIIVCILARVVMGVCGHGAVGLGLSVVLAASTYVGVAALFKLAAWEAFLQFLRRSLAKDFR